MLALIIGLTLIAALAIGGLYFGIRASTELEDEPTEHGNGEP